MYIFCVGRIMMLQNVPRGAFLFFFVHCHAILGLAGVYLDHLGANLGSFWAPRWLSHGPKFGSR